MGAGMIAKKLGFLAFMFLLILLFFQSFPARSHEFLSNDKKIVHKAVKKAETEVSCQSTVYLYNASKEDSIKEHSIQYSSGTGVLLDATTVLTAAHILKGWEPTLSVSTVHADADIMAQKHVSGMKSITLHPDYVYTLIPEADLIHYATNFLESSQDSFDEEFLKRGVKTLDGKKYKEGKPDLAIIKLETPINLTPAVFLPLLPARVDLLSGQAVLNPSFGPIYLNNGERVRLNDNHFVGIRHLGITTCTYNDALKLLYEKYRLSGLQDAKYVREERHHLFQTKCIDGASGSPLICKDNKGNHFIAAIQSSIVDTNNPVFENKFAYSLFTPVTPYKEWIESFKE